MRATFPQNEVNRKSRGPTSPCSGPAPAGFARLCVPLMADVVSEKDMNIREYQIEDLNQVVRLFTESVHGLTAAAHDATQREAWASLEPDLSFWRGRLNSLNALVAESGADLAGFISYEPNGHIDLLYTAPAYARCGVASSLYARIEKILSASGIVDLCTESSIVARPFFERHGFRVTEEQRVAVRGVAFQRYAMHKSLNAAQRGAAPDGVSAALDSHR